MPTATTRRTVIEYVFDAANHRHAIVVHCSIILFIFLFFSICSVNTLLNRFKKVNYDGQVIARSYIFCLNFLISSVAAVELVDSSAIVVVQYDVAFVIVCSEVC
jgi:hypothetical protein